jgi:hypothetical protein
VEDFHRTVTQLTDQLPADHQKHLAILLEWAIEGIRHHIEIDREHHLDALHAAYAEARDGLVATLRKGNGRG